HGEGDNRLGIAAARQGSGRVSQQARGGVEGSHGAVGHGSARRRARLAAHGSGRQAGGQLHGFDYAGRRLGAAVGEGSREAGRSAGCHRSRRGGEGGLHVGDGRGGQGQAGGVGGHVGALIRSGAGNAGRDGRA
nr:hypothetical protein [Tanacetum cinerariifolium]